MQRRYRVLRNRRGKFLKVPPALPASPPPLIHQHRKARLPGHRRRGRLLQVPPQPASVPPPLIRQHRRAHLFSHRRHGRFLFVLPGVTPPPTPANYPYPAYWTVTPAGPLAATVTVEGGSPAGSLVPGPVTFPGYYAVPGAMLPGSVWTAEPPVGSPVPSGFHQPQWTATPAGPLAVTVTAATLAQGTSLLTPQDAEAAYPEPPATFGPAA